MVGVFLRLKARLVLNGLRGNAWRAVGFAIGVLYAAGAATAGFLVLVSARARPDIGEPITVLAVTALTIGWATLPLLGFGSDETLDPTRLALLPLSRRQLMAGLIAASLVGIGPIATAAVLAGAAIELAPIGAGVVLVVVAGVLELALCITLSRAVVTALSSALRSRRGRDLRIILVALLPAIPEIIRFVALPRAGRSTASLRSTANVAGWFPTGLAGRAMLAARHGHAAAAVLDELLLAGLVLLLIWAWARSLDRIVTTAAPAAAPRPELRSRTGSLPLFGALWTVLPRTRLGAVAARELRLTWREPRRRVQLVSGVVLPFIVVGGNLTNGAWRHPQVVYLAVAFIWLSSSRAMNLIGPDGRAWWIHEAAGADLAADLGGKCIALAITTVPLLLVPAVGLAAASDGWAQLPAAVFLGCGLMAVVLGAGSAVSVFLPVPVPDTSGNLWGTSSGQGCLTSMTLFPLLAAEALVMSPFLGAVLLIHGAIVRAGIGALSIVWGAGWAALGWRVALRRGHDRGPEILAAIEPSRAA
jgi:ABC-2 type transport system permease protein